VTAVDGFECVHVAGSSSFNPPCEFVRGYLAGIFSEMFGQRMDVTETLCVSRGHNRCQFDVSEAKQ
jgi:predicted hydrocarbon binding protein